MSNKEEKKKPVIIQLGEATFKGYLRKFAQRQPRYAVKQIGRGRWRTKKKPLSDIPIRAHLAGKYAVAVLGKWYPEYAILDIDNRPRWEAEEIREMLELDESNSMLIKSESEDSFHILFIPEYHGKPPTLNLLKASFENFCRSKRIEIYPQKRRPIRLPFGPYQPLLDIEYMELDSWQKKLYWLEKFNPFDLSSVKYHQLIFDFEPGPGKLWMPTNIFEEAQGLLDHGLQFPSSRHESQSKILFLLWKLNVPKENAIGIVWNWINEKHNGYSKDILRHPHLVEKEIERQADHIWNKYQVSQVYPDSTHNVHHGYITAPDILDIIEATSGSRPRMNFLYNLVKFSYPRRHRKLISIHRDKLIRWSSKETYLKYINELECKGIAERRKAYLPGLFSKDLKLDWKFRSSDEAVAHEGRSIETFEKTIRFLFKPDEFRQLLIKAGVRQSTASKMINSIWRKD